MAKRRGKSAFKPQKVFEWTSKEASDVLAYIEVCNEVGDSRQFIQDTIADHMKMKWNRNFTYAKIDNRLKLIHRRAHKPEYVSRRHIMSIGSGCLDLENLDQYFAPHELTLEDIRNAKKELKFQRALNGKRETEYTATRVSARLSATPGYLEARCSAARSTVGRGCSQGTKTIRGTSTRSPDSIQPVLPTVTKRKFVVYLSMSELHLYFTEY